MAGGFGLKMLLLHQVPALPLVRGSSQMKRLLLLHKARHMHNLAAKEQKRWQQSWRLSVPVQLSYMKKHGEVGRPVHSGVCLPWF